MIHKNALKSVNHAGWVIEKDVVEYFTYLLYGKLAIGFENADMATSYFSTLEALKECACRKGCI